jgi:predicted transglutaminase-like cysteine proteinase
MSGKTALPENGDMDMMKQVKLAAAVAMTAFVGIQPVWAAGPAGYARSLINTPTVSYIAERQPTLAPFAQVKFCMQNPGECRASEGASMVVLTSATQEELTSVNSNVNHTIVGVNDQSGEDVWSVNVKSGDCEDYALTKRDHLIAKGWSPRALRIAVATTRSGEGHAVLVVKTDRGDLVLDNRTSRIKPWNRTDLSWIKIQSGENPYLWYDL